jgi:Fungal specific transcription factor domain
VVSICSLSFIRQKRRLITKSDEKRPICNRCERCGFTCSGAKDITFIDQRKVVKPGRSGKNSTVPAKTRDHGNTQPMPKTPPTLKGCEIQIYICYTSKYLLCGGPVDLALQDIQLNDLCTAVDTRSDGHLFHISILSLATIFFGTQHHNTSILANGYLVHERALRQLNNTLSDRQCYLRDDVLLSVIALVLLEAFVPTGRKYYLKHTSGLEKLLELRGPSFHRSPRSRQTLKGVRRMIILASMKKRKPSILAREEWKSIPWMAENVAEQAEHYLWNVLADYTVLVADHDQTIQNSLDFEDIAYHQQREMIERRAQDLLKRLHEWKKAWDTDDQHSHAEASSTLAGVQSVPPCARSALHFQTTFVFQNPSTATMLMLYNTALIYVVQVLSSLLPANPQVQSSEDSSYLHPAMQNKYAALKRSAALEIYRCIPYYLAHKSQLDTGSLTIAHLAVRTAFQTLGGSGSLDGEWMMHLLNMKRGEVFAKGLWAD